MGHLSHMMSSINYMSFLKYILIINFLFIRFALLAQTPWTIVPTAESHQLIIVTDKLTTSPYKSLEINDYIGFFYESSPDTYLCAGAVKMTNADTIYATIYGDDGIDDGYELAENIRAVFWDASQNCQTDFGNLSFDFGPGIFVNGATSVINKINVSSPTLDFGSSILQQSDKSLYPAEHINFTATNITNISVLSSSIGLSISDTAVIDLNNSILGLHTFSLSANECLLHENFSINIVNNELPWDYQVSQSSESLIYIDSSVINKSNDTIEKGDVFGLFYDSLGVLYCGGYTIYDGNSLVLRAMGYTPGENGGFKSALQLGNLQNIYLDLWDASRGCSKHAPKLYKEDGSTILFFHPDSLVTIDSLSYSPDTSFSFTVEKYDISDNNPIIQIPSTFTKWAIENFSSGLSIDANGEVDLFNSDSGKHFVTVSSQQCRTTDSVYLEIEFLDQSGETLILSPHSSDSQYHSIYFPNKGKIDIIDRHGHLIESIEGPLKWQAEGINLSNGDYFAYCEDGTVYIISIIK